MERNVLIDEGKQLFVDADGVSDTSSVLQVRLTSMQADDNENVTFRVINVSGTTNLERVIWRTTRTDSLVPLAYKSQFIVRKNGVDVTSLPVSFGRNDVLEIVIYNSEIRLLDMNYIWALAGSNVFLNGEIDYYSDPVYRLRSVCYPGVFKVEVWADAFV
jgi:hypothetical protein